MRQIKVLGISASPRMNANSEKLLDKALEGAHSAGAKVEKIAISRLKISPCVSGLSCAGKSGCVIRDDMKKFLKKIDNADAVFISAPVYFGSVPAQLKVVIDRCQSVWVRRHRLKKIAMPMPTKRGLFICVSGHRRERFFRNSTEIIKIFFIVLGIRLRKKMYVANIEHPNDILSRKSSLKKAFRYGYALAI